jgi:hypothetical protein
MTIDGFDQREIPRRFDVTSRTGPPCSRLERRTPPEPMSGASRCGPYRIHDKGPETHAPRVYKRLPLAGLFRRA